MKDTIAMLLILTGLFCIILLSGCVTSPAGQQSTVQTATMPSDVTEGKNVTAIIPLFDAYAERTFQQSRVPGMAVAIVKDDTVIYLRCFGVKNITTNEPVTPHTRFQLASISKTFTSASIASMVGDGEIAWDERITSLYPGFRLSDPWVTEHVTLRDLLMHRAGLPAYGADELQEIGYNRSEIISRLRYLPLTGDYRSSYAYSNIGITTAAEAAARKAGMPWEDLVTERIFIPAGMANTSAHFDDFAHAADRVDTYPTKDGIPVPGPLLNDDVNSPAGGISSTISDMTRYAILQLNEGTIDGREVIAAPAIRETHRPQNIMKSTNTSMTAYDLGWETVAENGRIRLEHGGDLTSGVSTYITLWPEEKMGIIVLTNGFPAGHVLKKSVINGWDDLYFTGAVRKDWYSEIDRGIAEALKTGASVMGPPKGLPPAPAGAKPARSPDAYTGSYSQDYYGTVRIEADATGLLAYPGHVTEPFVLIHYDGDVFQEKVTGTGVKFIPGSNGIMKSVHIVVLDKPWMNATFTRK